MAIGSPVRVIRIPHFGSLGEIVDLASELQTVDRAVTLAKRVIEIRGN